MSNHSYQIGRKLYKQREGSAIRVDMSVESCSLYMTCWDNKLLSKLKELDLKVEVYFRKVNITEYSNICLTAVFASFNKVGNTTMLIYSV